MDSGVTPTPPAEQPAPPLPQADDRGQGTDFGASPRQAREPRRLAWAVLASLLFHAMLMSLSFGGSEPGLPGLGWPWQERRGQVPDVPDVRLVLQPAPATAPPEPDTVPQAVAAARAPTIPDVRAPTSLEAQSESDASAGSDVPAPAPAPAPAALMRADRVATATPLPASSQALTAAARVDSAAFTVPALPSAPSGVIAAAPSASSAQPAMPASPVAVEVTQERVDALAQEQERAAREALQQAALRDATRQEAQRVDLARLDAERQETDRLAAARQDMARQESQRVAASRLETARKEAQRVEQARLEADRQELVRQAAARQEAARQEALRVEAAQQEAARQEAARQASAQQDAARLEAAREEAARIERRRALGRQLDEEAARRDVAAAAAAAATARLAPRLDPSTSSARRGRLFGHADANAELVLYAEAWARKIQLNMTFDLVRDAARRPHTPPVVTVALRSDGSVESVVFVRSSGLAEMDDAVRRIVQSQTPYPVFPPGLAREYDVIEIRRTWSFDMAVRLY